MIESYLIGALLRLSLWGMLIAMALRMLYDVLKALLGVSRERRDALQEQKRIMSFETITPLHLKKRGVFSSHDVAVGSHKVFPVSSRKEHHMDMSEYKGFKNPLPTKGTVELEIVEMKEVKGNKEDENGDVSEGLTFKYRIVGPDSVVLNDPDRTSALGYEFEETLWKPRRSLMQKNAQAGNGMKVTIARQLEAIFGRDCPNTIEPRDYAGRRFRAEISSKFDDYKGDDIVVVQKRIAL